MADLSAIREQLHRQTAVSVGELKAAGSDRATVRSAARGGLLLPLWRGSYLSAEHAHSRHPLWEAALALAPGAVLCGASAARLHGLAVPDEWPEEIAVAPSVTQLRTRSRLVVRARDVPQSERTDIGGLAVTTLARTVLDVAVDRAETDAQWIVDQAMARGLLCGRGGGSTSASRRGAGAAAVGRGRPLSESPLEAALRLRLRGLPRPVAQHRVVDAAAGLSARLDLAWPDQHVALECDGVLWHSAPEPLLRDRTRQNALAAVGWRVLRGTWHDVHAPDRLRAVVITVLR